MPDLFGTVLIMSQSARRLCSLVYYYSVFYPTINYWESVKTFYWFSPRKALLVCETMNVNYETILLANVEYNFINHELEKVYDKEYCFIEKFELWTINCFILCSPTRNHLKNQKLFLQIRLVSWSSPKTPAGPGYGKHPEKEKKEALRVSLC